MPNPLSIIVHLDHLPSIKTADHSFYFSVNLACALNPQALNPPAPVSPAPTPPAAIPPVPNPPAWDPTFAWGTDDRLMPWRWQMPNSGPIPAFQGKVWKAGETTANAIAIQGPLALVTDWAVDVSLGNAHLLPNYVVPRLAQYPATNPNPFYRNFEPAAGTGVDGTYSYTESTSSPASFFDWALFLQGASRLPAPQKLGLSFLVKISRAQLTGAGIDLTTAASFNILIWPNPTVGTKQIVFNSPPTDVSNVAAGQTACKLTSNAGDAVYVQPVEAEVNPAAATGMGVHLPSLWVNNLEVCEDGHDWVGHVMERMPAMFDPAQHLVDILRQASQPGGGAAIRDSAVAAVPLAVLRLSRELAGFGGFEADSVAAAVALQIPRAAGDTPEKFTNELKILLTAAESGAVGKPALAMNLARLVTGFSMWQKATVSPNSPFPWLDMLCSASPQLKGILKGGGFPTTDPAKLLATLEIFTAQLADAAILKSIVTAQWQFALQNAIAQNLPLPTTADVILSLLAAELSARDVRRRYQNALAADVAKALLVPGIDAFAKQTGFGVVAAVVVQKWLADQFAMDFPTGSRPPILTQLSNLAPASKNLLQTSFQALADDGTANESQSAGKSDAHPVLLVVDVPDHLDNGTAGTAEDVQRQLAGVAVLMRKNSAGEPWRCLNMANAAEAVAPNTTFTVLTDLSPVINPSAFTYLNGIRHSVLAYDNQLLGAVNPIVDAAINTAQQDKPTDGVQGWLKYLAPGTNDSNVAVFATPVLAFGRQYQVAACGVTNSGQVPVELVDNTAKPDGSNYYTKAAAFPLAANALDTLASGIIKTFTYQRRTPVGRPRFVLPDGPSGGTSGSCVYPCLTPVPAGVRPLASELTDPTTQTALVTDQGPPLLLVGPSDKYKHTFSIKVRLPSTTHQIWERWQRTIRPPDLNHSDFPLMHGGILSLREENVQGEDASLDDPAVESQFVVCCEKIFPVHSAPVYSPLVVPPPKTLPPPAIPPAADDQWPAFVSLLNRYQRNAATLTVTVAPDAVTATGFDAIQNNLTVEPGDIWRISISAVVKADYFQNPAPGWTNPPAGSPKVQPPLSAVAQYQNKQKNPVQLDVNLQPVDAQHPPYYYACAPAEIIVEAAQPDVTSLPASDVLWSAMELIFDGPTEGNTEALRVTLQRNKLVDRNGLPVPAWANVGAVQLQYQQWKWHGRPTIPPPPTVADDQANVEWDAWAYTLRDGEEFTTETMPFPLEKGVTTSPSNLNRDLKRLPLKQDPRCLHFRWSLRVFNRYAPTVGAQALHPDASIGRWKRVLVPCRLQANDPVAPPPLKFILPLTGDVDPNSSTPPGLLCVFYDEWYEKYGLSDQLVAGIRAVQNSADSNWYLQYGPDPILDGRGLAAIDSTVLERLLPPPGTAPAPNAQPAAVFPLDLLDPNCLQPPFGHTFDRTSVSTPQLLNSSFLLKLPPIGLEKLPNGKVASGWDLVQLTFKRKLINYGSPNSTLAASAWTPPQWVQMLHGRTALLPYGVAKQTVVIKLGPGQVSLELNNSRVGLPYVFTTDNYNPSNANPLRFACWLVITREIFDASGCQGEVYLATLRMKSDASGVYYETMGKPPPPSGNGQVPARPVPAATGKCFVRWIEIQTRNAVDLDTFIDSYSPDDDPCWRALFPDETNQDAVARITNMSCRVEAKAGTP